MYKVINTCKRESITNVFKVYPNKIDTSYEFGNRFPLDNSNNPLIIVLAGMTLSLLRIYFINDRRCRTPINKR